MIDLTGIYRLGFQPTNIFIQSPHFIYYQRLLMQFNRPAAHPLLAIFLIVSLLISCNQQNEQESEAEIKVPLGPKLDKLKLQSGFRAEHLYSPSDSNRGSWVAMTFDDRGRLITSDQYGALYRLTLAPIGSDSILYLLLLFYYSF